MALIDKPLRLEDEMSNLKMKATEIRAPKPDMSEWTGGESYMDIDMDRPVTPALEGVFGRIDKEAEDRKMVAQWKAKQEAQQVQPPATTAAFMKSFVDKEFGGVDPYTRDPFKEARTRLDQNIQPIFKAALPGVKWGSKLTPDQNNHFAKIVKEGLERYYKQQKSSIDSAKTLYDHRKGEFEGFQKEKAEREKKSGALAEFKRKEEIKREVAAEFEKPAKTLTVNDINKRLVDLQKSKVRLQTTKGADPLTLFLMKDNPEAQQAFKEGDVTGAVAEIEGQIEYYEDLRTKRGGGLWVTGKIYTNAQGKRAKYLGKDKGKDKWQLIQE